MKRSEHQLDMLLDNNLDIPGRTVFLNDGIDDESLELVLKGLHLLGPKPLTIKMNSGGGDISPGLAICDLIERHGHVTIDVAGKAESMAAVILQSARWRRMLPNSHLMLHQGIQEVSDDHKKNIKSFLKLTDKFDDRCDEIVLKRIQEKHKKYSWVRFREETLMDTYFTASEALKWNLIDEIIKGK